MITPQRLMMYLSLLIGFIASIYIGFYLFFVGGITYLISYITVINGCLVISKLHVIIASLKIITSGFIFWFIMGFFLSTAKNFKDDDDGAPTNAEAIAI